jgi:hypothetical protein
MNAGALSKVLRKLKGAGSGIGESIQGLGTTAKNTTKDLAMGKQTFGPGNGARGFAMGEDMARAPSALSKGALAGAGAAALGGAGYGLHEALEDEPSTLDQVLEALGLA